MEKIIFTHVYTLPNMKVRVYESNYFMSKNCMGGISQHNRTAQLWTDEKKQETREVEISENFNHVAISDAHGHIERLVFPAWKVINYDGESIYLWDYENAICGKITFKIYGGSRRDVHPDAAYLRKLASTNGFKFGGVKNEI